MDKLHNVKIYGDSMLELLMDRLTSRWNPSPVEEAIYRLYYTDMIESDAFDDQTFDVMRIVDNDWTYNIIITPSEAVDNYNLNLAEDLSDENMSEIDFAYAVADALGSDDIGVYIYEVDGKYYIMTVG